jgi:uncharacterized membrane protein YgcG
VYASTENWDKAVARYHASLILLRAAGDDITIAETRLQNARDELAKQTRLTKLAPWAGAAVGAVLGLGLLFLDAISRKPIMQRWYLVLPMLAFLAAICAAAGGVYVYFAAVMRESYLLKAGGAAGADGTSPASNGAQSFGGSQTTDGGGGGRSQSTAKPKIRRKVDHKPPWAKGGAGREVPSPQADAQ